MRNSDYTPERGDIVWITIDPSVGKEQKGRRPALILSNSYYNQFGLAYIAPITSKIKGYGIEVLIPKKHQVDGAILVNQVFAADWALRQASYIESVDGKVMLEVRQKLSVILGL